MPKNLDKVENKWYKHKKQVFSI